MYFLLLGYDINLGTLLLQCQVPTWLGGFEYVKPNHTPARVYPITKKDNLAMISIGQYAQVKQKRACLRKKKKIFTWSFLIKLLLNASF